ncbi:MAG: hypothetical protein QOG87_2701, partial [Actinomycetota bacterium]
SAGTLHYDEWENIVGGVRLPLIDVPIAKYYAGEAPPGSDACGTSGRLPLVGSTRIFTADELRARYATSDAYAAEFSGAVEEAVAAGVLLPESAGDLLHRLHDAKKWVAVALGEEAPVSPVPSPVAPPVPLG